MMYPLGPLSCPDVVRGAIGGSFAAFASASVIHFLSSIPWMTYAKRPSNLFAFSFDKTGS